MTWAIRSCLPLPTPVDPSLATDKPDDMPTPHLVGDLGALLEQGPRSSSRRRPRPRFRVIRPPGIAFHTLVGRSIASSVVFDREKFPSLVSPASVWVVPPFTAAQFLAPTISTLLSLLFYMPPDRLAASREE